MTDADSVSPSRMYVESASDLMAGLNSANVLITWRS